MQQANKGVVLLVKFIFTLGFLGIAACGGSSDSADTTEDHITLFAVPDIKGDAITSRAVVDKLCKTNIPKSLTCTNTTAFISMSSSDQLKDLTTNSSVPSDLEIQATDKTVLADDFSDLIAGGSGKTIPDVTSNAWWSFSESDGTANATNCNAEGDEKALGLTGADEVTADNFISTGAGLCTDSLSVLCLCY